MTPPNILAALSVVWLPGAGHTAWESDWPSAVRSECEHILGALTPRASVEIYVPDQDYIGRGIDALKFADELRDRIKRTTGGQTTYHTDGDFCPPGRPELKEKTLVIKTFLPTVVTDEVRLQFIDMFVDFGRRAAQDVVQVEICSHGFWLYTGLFRELGSTLNGTNGKGALRRG